MIKHGFQKVPFRGYQAGAEEVLCHFSKSGSYHVLCCYLKTLLEAWSDHCSLPSAVLSAQTNGRVSSFGLEFYKRTAKLPKASRVVVGGLSEGRPKGQMNLRARVWWVSCLPCLMRRCSLGGT